MEKNRRVWINVFILLVIQGFNSQGQASNISSSINISPVLTSSTSGSKSSLSTSGASSRTNQQGSTSAFSMLPCSSCSFSIATTKTSSISVSPADNVNSVSSSVKDVDASSRTSQQSLTSTFSPLPCSPCSFSIATTKTLTVSRSSTNIMDNKSSISVSPAVILVSSSVKDVGNDNGNDEPTAELYIWEFVAIGCGVFIFILLIVIVLLCCQNRSLKKKVKCSNYSLPIKENGQWIDNQDIPLWQKRASAFVSDNPVVDEAPAPTLTT